MKIYFSMSLHLVLCPQQCICIKMPYVSKILHGCKSMAKKIFEKKNHYIRETCSDFLQ